MNKKRTSLKALILVPVFILGILSVLSNVMAVNNIRKVNRNASRIADDCMNSISELSAIENETQSIHKLGLSHIIATDLNTMISIVEEMQTEQETLEQELEDYRKYVEPEDESSYETVVSNYETMKYELGNLMAYSALGKNTEAYALANGAVSESSMAIQNEINVMKEHANTAASDAREKLSDVYLGALVSNGIIIAISVTLLMVALYCVIRFVIKPILATNKDIRDIISGIDKGEGDLTRRVAVLSNDEIADLGNGINLFMDKLQQILKMIIENTNHMENVVREVGESVATSNDSATDLSAMTEELSATMQDVGHSVSVINNNTENVRGDVEMIAHKSGEINEFSNLGFIPFLQLCDSLLLTQSGYILTIDRNALINAFLCQQIQNLSFMYLMIPERSHCHKQNQNTDYHQRLFIFIVIVCFFALLMVMMLVRLLLISLLSWSIAFLQLSSPPKIYFMQNCLFDTSFVIP